MTAHTTRLEARASRRLLRREVCLQLARSHLRRRELRRAKHLQRGRHPARANTPLELRPVPPELLLPGAPRGQQGQVVGRLRRRVQQRAAERREVGEQQLQWGAGVQEAELQLTVVLPGVGGTLPEAAPLRAVEVVLREEQTPQVPPGHPQRVVGPMRLHVLRRNSQRRPPPPPNNEALQHHLWRVLVLEAQQSETRRAVVQVGRGLVSVGQLL